jgi:hypothetical protein
VESSTSHNPIALTAWYGDGLVLNFTFQHSPPRSLTPYTGRPGFLVGNKLKPKAVRSSVVHALQSRDPAAKVTNVTNILVGASEVPNGVRIQEVY